MKTSSNIEPAGRFRDEEKQARKMAKRFKDIITQVNEFHAVILDNPELWFTPELQQTRQFVEKINQDPSHFPSTTPQGVASGEVAECPSLTAEFAQEVYNGTICDNHELRDDNIFPIVVVTAVDSRYHTVKLGVKTNQEKRYTLHVADGDDNILTIKIPTHLNKYMGSVSVGSVIELIAFRRGFIQL
jgi:hypothetical protein